MTLASTKPKRKEENFFSISVARLRSSLVAGPEIYAPRSMSSSSRYMARRFLRKW